MNKNSIIVLALVGTAAAFGFAPAALAHHNSPMYEYIETIEHFDNMDMHEAAITRLTDRLSDARETDHRNMTSDDDSITVTRARNAAKQHGRR